ncbi:MAG: PIN domain-containing protein, partial [Actinobacteria bacterium]|nr:PIN domain-containing protein [Actinomycetota bacterium]
ALKQLDELNAAPSISAFALAELLVDFEKSDLVDVNETLNQLTKVFSKVINLDQEVAVRAAHIRSQNKITLGDSIIVASSLIDGAELLTFDKNMRAVYERVK